MINVFRGDHYYLSNFYPSPVVIHGLTYPTAEHAFQAGKVADQGAAVTIASQVTPTEAKRVGRSLPLRDDWEEIKDEWMGKVVYEKFRQHPELQRQLLDTGDTILIEGNTWHDQVWGDCTCFKHHVTPGENRLGRILMKTREELGGFSGR